MSLVVLVGYLVGAAAGLLASRSARTSAVWSSLVRAQLLVAALVLSVAAAWRLTGVQDVVWPLLVVTVSATLLCVAVVAGRGPRRYGVATLRAWTATPNSGYFVVPVAAALTGSAGLVVAVLVDRLGTPLWALYVHLLRRDAPVPQQRRTSWVDQSPLLGFAAGLLLRGFGPAPEWVGTVSLAMAPVMAATGAAIFVGSALHPTQRIAPGPGVRPWFSLVLLRIVLLVPVLLLAPNAGVAVVVTLCALSIPAFGPSQFSTVYGYAEPVVAAAARYGWYVGALGLVVAGVIAR